MIRSIIRELKIGKIRRNIPNSFNFPRMSSMEKSPLELEKEMFTLKRQITSNYLRGQYSDALNFALELESKVLEINGQDTAVYASCCSNVALMLKMLGQDDKSMEKYTQALHVYEDVVGKKHSSYAATLANLGVLMKDMAKKSKGMDKLQLMERSEEALKDALDLRNELLGPLNRETIYSLLNLSSLLKLKGDSIGSFDLLTKALEDTKSTYGESDTLTATVYNNLGLNFKSEQQYQQAEENYDKALSIRRDILGEYHQDTIVTLHNIAELELARGNEEVAQKIQKNILDLLEQRENREKQKTSQTETKQVENTVETDEKKENHEVKGVESLEGSGEKLNKSNNEKKETPVTFTSRPIKTRKRRGIAINEIKNQEIEKMKLEKEKYLLNEEEIKNVTENRFEKNHENFDDDDEMINKEIEKLEKSRKQENRKNNDNTDWKPPTL